MTIKVYKNGRELTIKNTPDSIKQIATCGWSINKPNQENKPTLKLKKAK